MLIPEMAPYIYGEKTTRAGLDVYRIEQDLFDEVAQAVEDIEGTSDSLLRYEKPNYFYKSNPDIEHIVPKYAQEEIFFALKNGYANAQVPAKVIYMLTKAYHSVYEIPNLVFKALSKEDFDVMFQANYLKDVCMCDVVRSFICEDYTPITYESPIKKHTDYAEIYVAETDMVVAAPLDIANGMSATDARNLRMKNGDVCLGDIPLRTLGGHYGAINSRYDLRECI